MTGLEQAYETVFTAALVFLGVMLLLCLIRRCAGRVWRTGWWP